MTRKLMAAVAILAASAAAYAMTEFDANGDGTLSMDEFMVAYPTLTDAEFNAADVDADGQITETELADAVANGVLPETQG